MAVRGKYMNYVLDDVTDLDGLAVLNAEGARALVLTTPRKLYFFVNGAWELQASGDLPDKTGNANKFLRVKADESDYELAPVPGGGDMLASNNLSDVVDDIEAVTNLGLHTKYNATQDISAFDVVTSTGEKANSNTIALRGKVIGIALASAATGHIGYAVGCGPIKNAAWSWTVGDKIFLNGATLSTIPVSTGFGQSIGTATATDTIDVKLGTPVLL